MKINQGVWDRGLRVVLGLGLLSLIFLGPQTGWGVVGLVPLVTGLWGFCPLYRAAGMTTCPADTRASPTSSLEPRDSSTVQRCLGPDRPRARWVDPRRALASTPSIWSTEAGADGSVCADRVGRRI